MRKKIMCTLVIGNLFFTHVFGMQESKEVATLLHQKFSTGKTIYSQVMDGISMKSSFFIHGENDSEQKGMIRDLSWSPNNKNIAVGHSYGIVDIWNIEKKEPVLTIKSGFDVDTNSIDYASDSTKIVAGFDNGTIGILDLESEKYVLNYNSRTDTINSVKIGIDDNQIIVSAKNRIILYDTRSKKSVKRIKTHHTGSIAYNSKNNYVTAKLDKIIKIWDLITKKRVKNIENNGSIASIAYSQNGNLTSGDECGNIKIWDVNAQKVEKKFEINGTDVRSLKYSPDENILALIYLARWCEGYAEYCNHALALLDVKEGKIIKMCPYVYSPLAFSPDGNKLMADARMYDLQSVNNALHNVYKLSHDEISILRRYYTKKRKK